MSSQAPADLGNPEMDRYFVEFEKVGEEQWVGAGENDGASATSEFLEKSTVYEVRVALFNVLGEAIAGPGPGYPFGRVKQRAARVATKLATTPYPTARRQLEPVGASGRTFPAATPAGSHTP